jgi:hypothetical protein
MAAGAPAESWEINYKVQKDMEGYISALFVLPWKD